MFKDSLPVLSERAYGLDQLHTTQITPQGGTQSRKPASAPAAFGERERARESERERERESQRVRARSKTNVQHTAAGINQVSQRPNIARSNCGSVHCCGVLPEHHNG
eukprot:175660-Rhodomonas_salina.2